MIKIKINLSHVLTHEPLFILFMGSLKILFYVFNSAGIVILAETLNVIFLIF
jgi:hypothetical protein